MILKLGRVSNERYENSTFYGSFRFSIFILIFLDKQFCISVQYIQTCHFTDFFYGMADIQNHLFIKYKDEYQKSKWTIGIVRCVLGSHFIVDL